MKPLNDFMDWLRRERLRVAHHAFVYAVAHERAVRRRERADCLRALVRARQAGKPGEVP